MLCPRCGGIIPDGSKWFPAYCIKCKYKVIHECGEPMLGIDYDLGQARQIGWHCPKCERLGPLDKIIFPQSFDTTMRETK